jgi:glycosyltransferase involved in cell wall biosynthesis
LAMHQNNSMSKILIISYYWPPSGGAGVQRWLKLSKYLAQIGSEVHVLTVDPKYASYMQLDEQLLEEVSDDVIVHKSKSFEPINYYARLVGKDKVPTAGFGNVNTRSFKVRFVNFLRSNLFIPDPRKGWKKYAVKKALEIIDRQDIKLVISTSPPHSTQLIGKRLQKLRKITWIADLRDPWTDIYYYPLLQHSFISKRIDRYLEKKVLEKADRILTVNEDLQNLFLQKSANIKAKKFKILPNGFDPADFNELKKEKSEYFRIVYTGTMTNQYEPDTFILALADFIHSNEVVDIRFNITGKLTEEIRNKITSMKLDDYFTHSPTLPHASINQVQKNADLLLLLIPKVSNDRAITTGKIYEYLATGNPVLCLGPQQGDAASILRECGAGKCFEREDFAEIKNFIIQQYLSFREGSQKPNQHPAIGQFDRKRQAEELLQFLREIQA